MIKKDIFNNFGVSNRMIADFQMNVFFSLRGVNIFTRMTRLNFKPVMYLFLPTLPIKRSSNFDKFTKV